MSITRKEFFRQGFLSLGKTALELADTLKGEPASPPMALPEMDQPAVKADMAKVAIPDNERCLARSCGCFACVERCEPQAIMVVPGEGIRIDATRCNGCGSCEYVCPVSPKAVRLAPRHDAEAKQ